MTFNLTAHLARQRINIGTLAVKIAAREILQCPDEQKKMARDARPSKAPGARPMKLPAPLRSCWRG